MKKRSILKIEVDASGRVLLPAQLARRYGLTPGAVAHVDEEANGFHFSRGSDHLARIYIEPTNACNLNCVTCVRNVWDEPTGWMKAEIFQRVLDDARNFNPIPSIFFGGFGEPLTHPRILKMVDQACQTGAQVELITNGILLSEPTLKNLIAAGLDRLWVSLDGASPESYSDVRLGAAFPQVIANLRRFKELRAGIGGSALFLGIAFVAMKRNIADLPELVRLGKSLGADQFSITNVLPHTPELRKEMLYGRSFYENDFRPSERSPLLALPRLEINALTGEALLEVLKNRHLLSVAQHEVNIGARNCPFVEKGSVSIRWDGAVSPCLALLHTHKSYLEDYIRVSHAFSVGSLENCSLAELWNDPAYRDLREHLLRFDFSPCVTCNSCEMAESNREDCFGNTAPTCGGCLWGQGFIQCP